MTNEEIGELINRRRRQILVHSYLYYSLNTNIIDDTTYDLWSKELAELQKDYPNIADKCVYKKAFAKFDGSSGFDLPYDEPNIIKLAFNLLDYNQKLNSKRK